MKQSLYSRFWRGVFRLVPRGAFEFMPLGARRGVDTSGGILTNANWQAVSTASTCINLLSGSLCGLDWKVYQDENGRRVVADHPLNLLLREPSIDYDCFTFFESLYEDLFANGNAFMKIERGRGGAIMSLIPLRDQDVSIQNLYPSRRRNYRYFATTPNGKAYQLESREIVHLHNSQFDLTQGRSYSPIRHAAKASLAAAAAADTSLFNYATKGFRSPGWIETEMDATQEQTKKIMDEFITEFSGNANSGKVPVLPGGFKFHGIQIPPIDQYIISILQWTVQDIARAFGVPMALIHSVESKTNSQLERHWASFLRTTLARHAMRVGSQLSFKLLSRAERVSGLFIAADMTKINTASLVDAAALVKVLSATGVLELDELRRLLTSMDLEPKPNGLDNPPQTAGAPERKTTMERENE